MRNRVLMLIGMTTALLLPDVTLAAADPCQFVPGGCPQGDIVSEHLIPTVASLMIRLAGGLAIIMIIVACIQILASWGDEGKISSAKNSIIYALIGIGVVVLSQLIVSFAVSEGQDVATRGPTDLDITAMADLVRIMLRVFNVLFAIAIFIAGTRAVLARGKEEEYNRARTALTWSIVAAVLTNISHFAVQIIITTFS